MSRALRILAILAASLAPVPAAHAEYPITGPDYLVHNVHLYKLEFMDGGRAKEKIVAHISPTPFWTPHLQGRELDIDMLARGILARANDWLIRRYRSFYRDQPSEFFDRFAARSADSDLRSHTTILFKDDSFERIEAMVRFAYPKRDLPRLPLEMDLDWDFPRPPVYIDPAYPVRIVPSEGEIYVHRATVEAGGVAEIKSFIAEEGNEEDLLPVLLREGYNYRSHESHSKIRPSTYLIECLKKAVPYYERLGFEHLSPGSEPKPVKDGVYVMKISDRKLLDVITGRFFARPGGLIALHAKDALVDFEALRARWLELLSKEAACATPLGHTLRRIRAHFPPAMPHPARQ